MLGNRLQCVTTRNVLCLLTIVSVVLISSNALLLWTYRGSVQLTYTGGLHKQTKLTHEVTPIGSLMAQAEDVFSTVIGTQTYDLHTAAQSYRAIHGRHPPPGFDKWFHFAQSTGAVIAESLFDQIYRDLTPFWGVPADKMRNFANSFGDHIYVRNGTANMTTNHGQGTPNDRMVAWLDVVTSIQEMLPDLDMAINVMDESRVIVPWESIDKLVTVEIKSRHLLRNHKVTEKYMTLPNHTESPEHLPQVEWIGPGEERYWDIARVGCAPQAPARFKAAADDFRGPPLMEPEYPMRTVQGYVRNWTYVRDPCQQRYLQEAHGTFIEPISVSTTHSLVPIFGESKLSMNNDILIPPAAYLSETFAGGQYSNAHSHGGNWSEKISGVFWRGVASGGRNREENWTRFHRHRFVAMMNGSYVRSIERDPQAVGVGKTFKLQSYAKYRLNGPTDTDLGTWLSRIANVGFTKLLCWPATSTHSCNYTEPYYGIVAQVEMEKQYNHKLLPDIDGNSFSGRYLAFLRSTSAPIKATIYSEWHDDRLVPWLHFIPMDNSFVDIYGILDYFVGTGYKTNLDDGRHGVQKKRDLAAQKIAYRGKGWAEKVLRKEDMQIYMLRLLLEYARLCDDNRNTLGYVRDLEG
jgi:hypothetical protein